MPEPSGDFATEHRRDMFLQPQPLGRLSELDQSIVFRRDGQFNSFAGERHHSFLNRGITMLGISKGMNMRIATDQTWCWDFAPEAHINGLCLALDDWNGRSTQTIF